MRKAQAKERMLFTVGVIVICLLAIVFVIRMISPSLESSREGQAKVMANMIAISANTLSTMDAGYVQKDFSLSQGSRPMTVEIYDKDPPNKAMYVKVTYDEKGSSYETPLLVKMDPVSPVSLNRVSVVKGMDGKISLEGKVSTDHEPIPSGNVCIRQPTPDEIKSYVNEAAKQYPAVDANLIKAVITGESEGCQCKGCKDGNPYVISSDNAVGLMQVLPSTAESMGAEREELYSAERNVMLGTKYLSDQIKAFGSVELGLAAYNAGPGWLLEKTKCSEKNKENCHECMKICGLTTKSTGQDIKNCPCLPQETRNYVPLVLGYRDNCYARNTCGLQVCKLC